MFKSDNIIEEIHQGLAYIKTYVDIKNLNGEFDINHKCEYFFCHLFNILYDMQLRNLNLDKKNYPSIDLGDDINSIGIQITTDASRTKINETIKTYIDNGVNMKYSRLKIFIVGYKNKYKNKIFVYENIQFNLDNIVFDFEDLVMEIEKVKMSPLILNIQSLFSDEVKKVTILKEGLINIQYNEPISIMGRNYLAYISQYYNLQDPDIPQISSYVSKSMYELSIALKNLNSGSRNLLCAIIYRRVKRKMNNIYNDGAFIEHVYFEPRDIVGAIGIQVHELYEELKVLKLRGFYYSANDTWEAYDSIRYFDSEGIDVLFEVVKFCEDSGADIREILINLKFDIMDL